MQINNNLQSFYKSNITQKLNKKTKSLQFLPKCLEDISDKKTLDDLKVWELVDKVVEFL